MPDLPLVIPLGPTCDTMRTHKPIEASLSDVAVSEQENFILGIFCHLRNLYF